NVFAVIAGSVDPNDACVERIRHDAIDGAAAVSTTAPLKDITEENDVHLRFNGVANRAAEHCRAVGIEQVELWTSGVRTGCRPNDLRHGPSVVVSRRKWFLVLRIAQVEPSHKFRI